MHEWWYTKKDKNIKFIYHELCIAVLWIVGSCIVN